MILSAVHPCAKATALPFMNVIRTRDPSGGGSGAGARWDRQKMGVKQPTHSICPIYVISGSTRLPDKVTASGFVASQVDGAQVGGWPAALMAELPAKEERWRQLGYANHRDWRLAVEKSSDATRQGQRASIAACQMVPRPRQLASLLPRHQWCPLGSAARTTRPAQRACCANGSMIIALIRICKRARLRRCT